MDANEVKSSRTAVDRFLSSSKDRNDFPDIDLQTHVVFVAGDEPPGEAVEHEACEALFIVFQYFKALAMAKAALEWLDPVRNSIREPLVAPKWSRGCQKVDTMCQELKKYYCVSK